ncbi:type II toxin-antitoxin system prevent-host-death family antitoxin [Aurantimonas sp. C2-6-R+9]|uniref:type II toxin-antitoxin system Phd/YefM family antitoxin n=1 Tax=unclassified Aurantimonas TaxID=2638230 RepID=UPI002E175425|nr:MULTISPECIES: type II toxin-antitoxin system prevent-host-death family antitoxin [unclassified Aurantimonas]MEC5382587.1 type II toxin-antitoxin system prevent-host-death family antitoxin [Aurantimonas sp. C2-6-R+9]MEC5413393.1 type II toxin-antitoxin system prevent-host-death family antitoxin [Aurantimonas sp. C2-4-R8]
MGNQWSLQDAKNKFSAVVEAALNGRPQRVTRRGESAVVVVSAKDFDAMKDQEIERNRAFVRHLLSAPKVLGPGEELIDENDRAMLVPRDVEFD